MGIEKPDIKITFGLNNKKEYFESDNVFGLLEEIKELKKENTNMRKLLGYKKNQGLYSLGKVERKHPEDCGCNMCLVLSKEDD